MLLFISCFWKVVNMKVNTNAEGKNEWKFNPLHPTVMADLPAHKDASEEKGLGTSFHDVLGILSEVLE